MKTDDFRSFLYTLMIEVNKRLYIDEGTLGKTAGFWPLQRDIRALYLQLLS